MKGTDSVRDDIDMEAASRRGRAVRLSGKEAAEHLGVSWPSLRQTILEHRNPHLRLGTLWKIDVSELDDHLRQLARGHADAL